MLIKKLLYGRKNRIQKQAIKGLQIIIISGIL